VTDIERPMANIKWLWHSVNGYADCCEVTGVDGQGRNRVQFSDGYWVKTVPESGSACLECPVPFSRGQQSGQVVRRIVWCL